MDDDATVRLIRPGAVAAASPAPAPAPRASIGVRVGLAGAVLAVLGLGGAALWWPREAPPVPASAPPILASPASPPAPAPVPRVLAPPEEPRVAAPPVAAPPALLAPAVEAPVPAAEPVAPPIGPPLLDQAAIADHRARTPTAFRWAANPLVFVLDFPDLATQGAAMNRAAAFIEKARAPRNRVLDDVALAEAIAADGSTPSDYYFGHNYRVSDLERMFAQAERDGVTLNPQERWLREQVALARRLDRSRDAAILTIPGLGPEVSPGLRRAILRHELSHGQFFTQPLFAAHVMRVWEARMTEAERAAIRAFLGREGYDTRQEEMMANEAMAYLLHTPDREVFNPIRELGWSEAQVARVRALFAEGAPPEP